MPPNDSLTILALAMVWYAHKRKHEGHADGRRTSETRLVGKQDEDDEIDPLRYTTLQVFSIVPATLGLASLVSRHLLHNEGWLSARWKRMLEEKSVGELLRATYFAQMFVYFGLGSAFLAVDLTGFPEFIRRTKIQKHAKIDYKTMLPKLFGVLTMNLGLPALVYLFKRLMMIGGKRATTSPTRESSPGIARVANTILRKYLRFDAQLPSVREVSLHTAGFLMMYDMLFFYSHKWLHHRSVYAHIHKLHHEWKSPTALAAAYAHPVEHLLSNLLPAAVGVFVLRPHFLTFNVFSLVGLLITLFEHSGYELVDTHAFHNLHHAKFQDNYGTFFWWDEWYGTRVHPSSVEGR